MLDHRTRYLTENMTRIQEALATINNIEKDVGVMIVSDCYVNISAELFDQVLTQQFADNLKELNEAYNKTEAKEPSG